MKSKIRAKLHEIVEELHKISTGFFAEHGSQPPILFVLKGDKLPTERQVVDLQDYIEDKELLASMIQAYQNQDGVIGTIFMSEAWVIKVDTKSEEGKRLIRGEAPRIQPSESSEREEVLFYMAETLGGNLAAQAPIIRRGKKATLGKLEFSPGGEDGEFEGRLIGGTFR